MCVSLCEFVCEYIYEFVCVCVSVYECVCVSVYVCVCVRCRVNLGIESNGYDLSGFVEENSSHSAHSEF